MVIKTMSPKTLSSSGFGVAVRSVPYKEAISSRSPRDHYRIRVRQSPEGGEETEDVIDLGAPRRTLVAPREPPPGLRRLRPSRAYTPNPRLYPGPKAKPKPKSTPQAKRIDAHRRRRKHVFRRPVPNARLYRPAPARPAPPPARPRTLWPAPAPTRYLDSASRAALRLSERRRPSPARTPTPLSQPPSPPARRLVVTLPGVAKAGGDTAPTRYRPASAHFRLRELGGRSGSSTPPAAAMEAGGRTEDRSEGDDTPPSAPSEFLAEFLSAIMRREYAEALKYCRLILQYEPHNATARGFYPLLRHKLQAHEQHARAETARSRSSSSEDATPPPCATRALHEAMEQEADESASEPRSRLDSQGSCASQSSLELDESDPCAHSSPSLSLSRRTATDHTDDASGGGWESTGTGTGTTSASRSGADDNGNAPAARGLQPADLENDNATLSESLRAASLTSESASLQRLRAQFACSIK